MPLVFKTIRPHLKKATAGPRSNEERSHERAKTFKRWKSHQVFGDRRCKALEKGTEVNMQSAVRKSLTKSAHRTSSQNQLFHVNLLKRRECCWCVPMTKSIPLPYLLHAVWMQTGTWAILRKTLSTHAIWPSKDSKHSYSISLRQS